MAIRGLDVFQEHFRNFEGAFLLIGGAACDDWFDSQGLTFRVTDDLDMVLILEALSAPFVNGLWEFIRAGGYRVRNRSEGGPPILYRFSDPEDRTYPVMLEIFSRRAEGLVLAEDQQVEPIRIDDADGLSAILLDDEYYGLLLNHRRVSNGVWMADATALVPLKARAWLDLSARRGRGEDVDRRKVRKHRNDVFGLAATLPGVPGPQLPDRIASDIREFLGKFPVGADEWDAILQSVRDTIGGRPSPGTLIDAIRTYYNLAS